MEDYNSLKDLLDTYQSLADWLKVIWALIPPATFLGLVAILRFAKEIDLVPRPLFYHDGKYVHLRDGKGRLRYYQWVGVTEDTLTAQSFKRIEDQANKEKAPKAIKQNEIKQIE